MSDAGARVPRAGLGERLRIHLLWLRHAWTFRWAHKPLCARFERDVLKLGRLHLCRSCVALYAGAAATATAWALIGVAAIFSPRAYAGLLVVTVVLSTLGLYRRGWRWFRDLVRFALGVLLVLAVAFFTQGHVALGILNALVVAFAWVVLNRRRGARKVRACDGCPELDRPGVCSGFAHQAACALRYEEAATARLADAGWTPAVLGRPAPGPLPSSARPAGTRAR